MNKTKKIHNYQDGSLPHKINVFHVNTAYRLFNFSCDDCKLKAKCLPVRHKSEVCKIANEARELLTNYTVGYVASFVSDDFYVKIKKDKKHNRRHEFENALFQLWSKYSENTK